jgi:hypothetical protein
MRDEEPGHAADLHGLSRSEAVGEFHGRDDDTGARMLMELVQIALLFSASLCAWFAVTLGLLVRFAYRGGVVHVKLANGARTTFPSAQLRREVRQRLARERAKGAAS